MGESSRERTQSGGERKNEVVISVEDDILVHESLFYVCIHFVSMRSAPSISFGCVGACE